MLNTRPWLRFVVNPDETGGTNTTDDNRHSDDNDKADAAKVSGDSDSEVERWKAFSRKWEERAKANEDARKRLEEIENSSKSELEKAEEKLAEANKKLAEAEKLAQQESSARLKADIASEFRISKEDRDLFLTASDEETLRLQADGLAKRRALENPNQGKGSGSSRASAEEWAKSLLK